MSFLDTRRCLCLDVVRPADLQGLPQEAHQHGSHLHPQQEGQQDSGRRHEEEAVVREQEGSEARPSEERVETLSAVRDIISH